MPSSELTAMRVSTLRCILAAAMQQQAKQPLPNERTCMRIALEADVGFYSVRRIYQGRRVEAATARAVLRAAEKLGIEPPANVVIRDRTRAA